MLMLLDAVLIYETHQRVLLKRYVLSSNRSLDGLVAKPNSKGNTPVGLGEGMGIFF